MDQNILDEMLSRITTLEDENERIRGEINEKKSKNQKRLEINKVTDNLENFEKGNIFPIKKYFKYNVNL